MRIVLVSQGRNFNGFSKKDIRGLVGQLKRRFHKIEFWQTFVAYEAFPAAKQAAEFFVKQINPLARCSVTEIHGIKATDNGFMTNAVDMIKSAPARTTIIVLFAKYGTIGSFSSLHSLTHWKKTSPSITMLSGEAIVLDDQTQTITCFGRSI